MRGEFAVGGDDRAFADLLDQRFALAAVFDQVGNGADLQPVFGGEQLQVRQAGHGAVVLHDLADHGGGRATGHGREVAAGLGVAGPHEHAAIHRLQREDVAGLNEVRRFGIAGHGRLHGTGAVGCGDACGDAFGSLDGNRECRSHLRAVARHHRRQLQAFAAFAGQRQADQPAAETRHEIDRFSAHVVRGEHQVAFVLAVFFVDQDDHAARAHLGNDVVDRRDRHGGGKGGAGCHGMAFRGPAPASMRST
jgi:hypothetical protein